jgi:hypothetical protein
MDDIDIELNAEATAALMAIQAAWATRMARANPEFLADLRHWRSTKWRPTRAGDAPTNAKNRHPLRQRGNPREA